MPNETEPESWIGAAAMDARRYAAELEADSAQGISPRPTVIKERFAAIIEKHLPTRIICCAFCGCSWVTGTAEDRYECLAAHVKQCPKHPLTAANERIKELETAAIANVASFDLINSNVTWSELEPAWWIAWSAAARLSRNAIKRGSGPKPTQGAEPA